jgi:ubiquitin-protein ligase
MVIKFPKRLKSAKKNPLEDFYEKCLVSLKKSQDLNKVQVTAFTVNPSDYKKLENLLKIHIKKNYPYLNSKRILFEAGMIMLNIGPRISKNIEAGTVLVDEDNIYGIFEV